MEVDSIKETSMRDLLGVLFRHKLIYIICTITVMTSIYIALDLRTSISTAQVKMLVTGQMQKDLEVVRSLGPGSLIATQMSLVKSRPVFERTVNALKLYDRPFDYERRYSTRLKKILIDRNTKELKASIEEMTPEGRKSYLFNKAMQELNSKISVIAMGKTSMFHIQVRDYNPVSAGIIANAISRSYVIFDLEQQIAALQLTYGNRNDTIKKLEKYIEKLEETLDGRILPDIEAVGPATVKIITQAGPGVMSRLRPTKAGGLTAAFILSIVLGTVLSFVFDFFDQTVRSPSDVENYLLIPYLGSIPKTKRKNNLLIRHNNLVTRYSQSFQSLSNKINLLMKDSKMKTIVFTDADGSGEIHTIIGNLGIYLSRKAGRKVLIIDANIRTSAISKVFNISDTPGLADILERKNTLEDSIQDLGSNLTVLPSGQTELNPIVLFESSMMSDIIKKANELYEIIFINCADIRSYTDAIVLSSFVDGIAIVINEGMVRRQIVKNAISPFELKNINIIGAVLNNHKYVIPEIIYRLT